MKPIRATLEIALVIVVTTVLEFAAPQVARFAAPILVALLGVDLLVAGKARWLFLAAVAIIPFPELQSNVLGPIELHHAFTLLAAAGAALAWFRTKPRVLPRLRSMPRPTLRLATYYVVLVGVTLVHFREVESWHRLTILFFLFLLAVLATHFIRTRSHLVELAYIVGATSVAAVAIGLGAFGLSAITRTYFENPYIHISTTEGVPRLAGTLLDSNFLGLHLLLALPACYAWLFTRPTLKVRGWKHTGMLLLTGLLTAALLLTYSRSAYIGLGAALVTLLVVLRPNVTWLLWLRRTLLALIASGVVATLLYLPFPFYTLYRTPNVLIPTAVKEELLLGFDPRALVEEYRLRVLNDPSLSDDERDQLLARDVSSDSLGYRLSFWRAGLQMFRENPLIGVGVGQFRYRFADYATIQFLRQPDAHNIYVEQLAETGLVGFALFLWVIGSAIRDLWRLVRRTDGQATGDPIVRYAAAATFAALVGILAQSTLLGGFGALPLFLALGVAGALATWRRT